MYECYLNKGLENNTNDYNICLQTYCKQFSCRVAERIGPFCNSVVDSWLIADRRRQS